MKGYILIPFLALEAALFILIQLWSFGLTDIFCFSSVLLAFLFSIFFARRSVNSVLLTLGLAFTVCADVFLVLFPDLSKELAMIFFNAVQICYLFIVLRGSNIEMRKVSLIFRAALISIATVSAALILRDGFDFLAAISVIYFSNLFLNAVFSFSLEKKHLIFSIGLVLFIFCDIFVGLSVLSSDYLFASEASLLYKLTHTGINLVWLFYLPSQSLIAISARKI